MLDTIRQIETPEGVFLRLRAAGALPRALAWLVDLVIRVTATVALTSPLMVLGEGGRGLYFIVVFVVTWMYGVICEVWFNGQTLGKRALDLRVVSADGAPVTLMPSVVRNLLRVVDILPGLYGVGLVAMLMDPHARRFGDIIAGTMVVHTAELQRGSQVPVIPSEPLPPGLSLEEQAAIVDFAERCPHLTPQRQRELADLLTPLTGLSGDEGVRRLVAYANDLLGRP